MRLAVVARRASPTNDALASCGVRGAGWECMSPEEALAELGYGDGALGRLDVRQTLDGIDDGLWTLGALAARGVAVLNDPAALLSVHDKLLTARLLRRHGLPHPCTHHVRDGRPMPVCDGPVVLKPRFGSWGEAVVLCEDRVALEARLERVRGTPWFDLHGALVQELVPPQGHDLRVVVAAGRVIGAVAREAAPGEWRTNVALGATRKPVAALPYEAEMLAVAAAAASRAELVGVDLLPDGRGGWTVLELNGAVEFTPDYALAGDVFARAAWALAHAVRERRAREAVSSAAAV